MRFPKSSKRGALAFAVTAAVLAAVILLNIGASALFGGRLLFWDMTNESMYRLNGETVALMKQTVAEAAEIRKAEGGENAKVTILFCADADLLLQNEHTRYIYYTARSLAKKFSSFIELKTTDVWSNPSSVDAYRVNSYSGIYQTDVIVSSGSEFRVLSAESFYTYSEGADEPWAYNGEKTFVKAIRAITRVETPICGVTVNHGEPLADESAHAALLEVVKGAGYRVQYLDLAAQEIPEECRMILIFDPQSDFTSGNYLSGEGGELGKLDAYLRNANSLFLFADPQTPTLPNLETFLEEWGIRFARCRNPENSMEVLGNYRVVSPMDSVDGEAGKAILAAYETAGSGASITKNMRSLGASPKVVFPNAMPLEFSPTYDLEISLATDTAGRYEFGKYAKNDEYRAVYKIFRSAGADRMTYAEVVGQDGEVLPGVTDARGGYTIATLTIRYDSQKEGNLGLTAERNSKVCVFGSTDFTADDLLRSSAYGNTDLLLEIMRGMSRDTRAVGFAPEWLHQSGMGSNYYSESGNRAWAAVLAIIPAAAATGLGVFVLVRRRRAR